MRTTLSFLRSGALLTLAWLLVASPVTAQRLFVSGDAFPLPSYANALRVDDFNADGTPDVAVTHGADGTASVLLGGHAPLLGAAATYPAGLGVVYVTSGDLNGDRFPELVLVNTGASSVSVLINEGDGTFRAGGEYPVGSEPRVAELGDFNADGAADVVATNLQSRDFQVLLGDGAGGFSDAGRVPVGDNPHHLTANDFDGDGRTDVAVAHSGAVTWFRGLADGAFERALDVPLAPDPRVLTSGDLNADGHVDLAVVDDSGTLLFLENPGDGRFEIVVAGIIPGFSFGRELVGFLVPVDYDGDGILDITTQFSLHESSGIQVYLGDRTNPLATKNELFLDAPAADLSFAELDGDGFPDVVMVRRDATEVVVHRSLGPGQVSARNVISLDVPPRDLVPLDPEGHANADVAVLGTDTLLRFRNDDAKGFEPPVIDEFSGMAFQDMVAGDFDGDGQQELALSDIAGPSALILAFAADGSVSAPPLQYPLPALPSQMAAADVDNDGITDLVVSDQASPVVTVIRRPGIEGMAEVVEVPLDSGQTAVAAGDLDADGVADIAVSTRNGLRVLFGGPPGTFPRSLAIDGFPLSRGLAIADVERDGTVELVVAASGGQLVVLSGVREGADPARRDIDVGGDLRPVDVVDVDGDGHLDLVTANQRSVVIVRQTAGGDFLSPERFAVGSSPRAFAFVDLGRDGRLDLATADYGSRSISILVAASGEGGPPPPRFRRGDADSDGVVNSTDAVVILTELFGGGADLPCPDAADADDDGALSLTDAVWTLAYLFAAGDPPPTPGPDACGVDPSDDALPPCETPCR